MAEADPSRPPVNACGDFGQHAQVYRVDGQHTRLSIAGGIKEPAKMNPMLAVTLALTSASILRPPETPACGQSTD